MTDVIRAILFFSSLFSSIILARTLQRCGESFYHFVCTHRTTVECIFMKFGTGELCEHLSSYLNFRVDRIILTTALREDVCAFLTQIPSVIVDFSDRNVTSFGCNEFLCPTHISVGLMVSEITSWRTLRVCLMNVYSSVSSVSFEYRQKFPVVNGIKLLVIGIDGSRFM
jgi:hypothetical protein